MKKNRLIPILAAVGLPLLFAASAGVEETLIVDILNNPIRHWNTMVTVVGQVQSVVPNPAGTTRGVYTVLDESGPNPLTIKTDDLPPVSRNFRVTGMIVEDPTRAGVPIMKEISRSTVGMAETTRAILIAAGVVFFILLIVFVILLTKSGKQAAALSKASIDPSRTTKIPTAPPPVAVVPEGAKTKVFLNLGADIIVDQGPDKGKEFPLYQPVTAIGRPGMRKNDIELNDETVSKEQALISYDGVQKVFSIANESATNPTRVNGRPIDGPTVIDDGALIEVGRTVLHFKKSGCDRN